MKVSLIVTALNEEDSIGGLLDSVTGQIKIPDEVIIVDAGSTDNTVQLIEEFKKQFSDLTIQLIKASGSNRSQGRNLAINKAKYAVIAATDAGCILHPDWLENITKPLEDNHIAVVGGAYLAISHTLWHRAAAQSASVNFNRANPHTFLPSSRSIAFHKSAWEKIGGYPEHLNTAEDLIFAQKLQQAGFKQTLALDAIVDWYFPNSTLKIIKQFYNYSYGDGLSGLESQHSKRYLLKTLYLIVLIVSRFIFPVAFGAILLVFLLWVIFKSLKASFHDHLFHQSGLIRGIYFWCHLGWALILFSITLLGFWAGLRKRIMNSRNT